MINLKDKIYVSELCRLINDYRIKINDDKIKNYLKYYL